MSAHLAKPSPAEWEHGLGLQIAQRVCDLQGWRLAVDSVQGEMSGWTEFRLVLPSSARCDPDRFSGYSQLDS